MTLADEDTNSILTDNDNRAIQGNVRKNYLVRKSFLVRKSYLVVFNSYKRIVGKVRIHSGSIR